MFVQTIYFTPDSLKQNVTAKSLLGPAFKPRRLDLNDDAIPTMSNFKAVKYGAKIGQKKRSYTNSQCSTPMEGILSRNSSSIHSTFSKHGKFEVGMKLLVSLI